LELQLHSIIEVELYSDVADGDRIVIVLEHRSRKPALAAGATVRGHSKKGPAWYFLDLSMLFLDRSIQIE